MNWGIFGNKVALAYLESIAKSDCLGNAYLFYGPEGIGKKSAAIKFAQLLNCECSEDKRCDSCNQIETLNHPELLLIEDLNKPRWFSRTKTIERLHGFGIKTQDDYLETVSAIIEKGLIEEPYPVMDPRMGYDCFLINTDLLFGRGSVPSSECYTPKEISESLRQKFEKGDISEKEYGLLRLLYELPVSILPYRGRIPVAYVTERSGWRFVRPIRRFLSFTSDRCFKIVIIDDAHKMTEEAQNSLLKTLEDTPAMSLIILVTSQKDLLFDTIRSRCQQIAFNPLSRKELDDAIDGLLGFKPDEYEAVLSLCEGSPGNLLNLLVSNATEEFVLIGQLFDDLARDKAAGVFRFARSVFSKKAAGRKRKQVEVSEALGMVAFYLTEMIKVKMGLKSVFRSQALAEALERQSRRFGFEKLIEAVEIIRERSRVAWRNVDLDLLFESTLLKVARLLGCFEA